MAGATELNGPTATGSTFRAQMDGLATALIYVLCFGYMHLGSGVEFLNTTVLAVFFAGLIIVPLLVCLPVVPVRRALSMALEQQSGIAAFVPLAGMALYALQAILIWVITREAYTWVFTAPPAA